MNEKVTDYEHLASQIKDLSKQLGFARTGITDTNLSKAGEQLKVWLGKNYHGSMHYMQSHGSKRYRPDQLVPETIRIICVALEYRTDDMQSMESRLSENSKAYISRYAMGRDYHKLVRKKLQLLASEITKLIGPFGYRVFTDSAPVMEKPLAEKAGLGWIGKHSNLLNKNNGSWFFLGEIYTDLPLPIDEPSTNHCGTCASCMEVCPTQAIVEPYVVDARRCIAYLTIENKAAIPEDLRPLMGNRIFGCDDCQLFCPFNKFSSESDIDDFKPRHQLDNSSLIELFNWNEDDFDLKTRGSAIRRTGYEGWLRNIAVALGNALRNSPQDKQILAALANKTEHSSALVREHVQWALQQSDTTD